jgi:hypothetical protein
MTPTKTHLALLLLLLSHQTHAYEISGSPYATQDALVPEHIHPPGEKLILVDPNAHAWGAYNTQGKLIRWGIATAGGDWCSDINRPCHTKVGSFRIYSLGDSHCASSKFPIPGGGAPMPYCMYFNGDQAIHGSNAVEFDNKSHGCVRVHVSDAEWLRYNFVEKPNAALQYHGTLVVIRPYSS